MECSEEAVEAVLDLQDWELVEPNEHGVFSQEGVASGSWEVSV